MLLTPHIVRTHGMTQKDFAPVFVGTQRNLGLAGPPPLIQPPAEAAPRPARGPCGAAHAAARAAGLRHRNLRAEAADGARARRGGRTARGRSPRRRALPAQPPGAPAVPPAARIAQPPAPVTPPASVPAQPAAAQPPPADAVRIILTPPGAPLMVATQPATVPISVFGASRISTVTLSLRFIPRVLRVRLVQEGTFMRQGGGGVTFAQQVDAVAGRVDITLTRAGDATGVSGDGVLASVVFDAVGSGISPLGLGGVVTGPGGLPVPVTFGTASITVR